MLKSLPEKNKQHVFLHCLTTLLLTIISVRSAHTNIVVYIEHTSIKAQRENENFVHAYKSTLHAYVHIFVIRFKFFAVSKFV